MTPLQPELLLAVLAEPDDDFPRLMAADWLEENGEGKRSDFIRVQCELASLDAILCHQPGAQLGDWCDDTDCPKCGRENALRRRERELWNAPLILAELPDASEVEIHLSIDLAEILTRAGARGLVRRGFVERVTLTAADWLTHAGNCFPRPGTDDPPLIPGTILAAQPVQVVALTTWPERCGQEHADGGWLFSLPGRKKERWYGIGYPVEYTASHLLAAEWPGIAFTLPPRNLTDNPQAALTDIVVRVTADLTDATMMGDERRREQAQARLDTLERWAADLPEED